MSAHEDSFLACGLFESKGTFQIVTEPEALLRETTMKEAASAILPENPQNRFTMPLDFELGEDFEDADPKEFEGLPTRSLSAT